MTDKQAESSTLQKLDYESALAMTQEEIQRLLQGAPPVIKRQTSHLAKTGGKNIRARALLACAAQEDGLIDPDAMKAASAIELFHLATLVHDDIIDNAPKRRGITALHKKFGEKSAVLCGDYLFCMAMELSSSMREPDPKRYESVEKTLPPYLSRVCLGEMLQDQNSYNFRLSESEYYRIIAGKTAALFEASFHAGFLLSGEEQSAQKVYTAIGSNIGIIFQLADDCADYESTQKAARKPVLSDFRQGVVTLPLIYALKNDRELRRKIKEEITPQELKAAVVKAGGLTYTHGKIAELYAETKKQIASLDTAQEKKKRLELLLCKSAGVEAAADLPVSAL